MDGKQEQSLNSYININYYGKKIMTYTMVKKTPFKFPTERYLNVIKRGYKDCKLDLIFLKKEKKIEEIDY